MTPKDIPVINEVCDFCYSEVGLSDDIAKMLAIDFPDIDASLGVPANHPYWRRREHLYSLAHQPVAHFSALDGDGYSICEKHLKELADIVAQMRGEAAPGEVMKCMDCGQREAKYQIERLDGSTFNACDQCGIFCWQLAKDNAKLIRHIESGELIAWGNLKAKSPA